MVNKKAREFVSKLSIDNFSVSNGWLEGFKRRNDIVFKNIYGESNAVDNSDCNYGLKTFQLCYKIFHTITSLMLMKRAYSTSVFPIKLLHLKVSLAMVNKAKMGSLFLCVQICLELENCYFS